MSLSDPPALGGIARRIAELVPARRLTLVDVGAAEGTPRRWAPLEHVLRLVGFEPDPRSFERLESSRDRIHLNTALHSREGPIRLHLARKLTHSSIYPPNQSLVARFPNPAIYETVETLELPATTLDAALALAEVDAVDFMKLDTEGSELDILRGATGTLTSTFGVEVEAEFFPIYEGQPLFADVDEFMRGMGFRLMDLRRYFYKESRHLHTWGKKGQLLNADVLYLRSPAEYVESLPSGDGGAASALSACAVCALFGYLGHGLDLVEEAEAAGHIDAHQARELRTLLDHPTGYAVDRVPARLRTRTAAWGSTLRRCVLQLSSVVDRLCPEYPLKRRGRVNDDSLGNPARRETTE